MRPGYLLAALAAASCLWFVLEIAWQLGPVMRAAAGIGIVLALYLDWRRE